jgi:hypothetical protein
VQKIGDIPNLVATPRTQRELKSPFSKQEKERRNTFSAENGKDGIIRERLLLKGE